jgi:hypothetical protein
LIQEKLIEDDPEDYEDQGGDDDDDDDELDDDEEEVAEVSWIAEERACRRSVSSSGVSLFFSVFCAHRLTMMMTKRKMETMMMAKPSQPRKSKE